MTETEAVIIKQDALTWQHIAWGLPSHISVNDNEWNLTEKKSLPNSGDTAYLPFEADFTKTRIIECGGRDIVALQMVPGGVKLVLADTTDGSDAYSATLEFQSVSPAKALLLP